MRACVAVGTRGGSLASTGARAARAPCAWGERGGFCVACCWGLMAAIFALGVKSTGWMALVAALIAAERLLPWKTIAGCGVAVALALLAPGVALAPEDVPGFTIPGSHQGEATMDSMQMP